MILSWGDAVIMQVSNLSRPWFQAALFSKRYIGNEKRVPGCLGYIGDTQLNGDYNKNRRIPFFNNQDSMESKGPRFFLWLMWEEYSQHDLASCKRTWHNMDHLKMHCLLKMGTIHCHVSLLEGNDPDFEFVIWNEVIRHFVRVVDVFEHISIDFLMWILIPKAKERVVTSSCFTASILQLSSNHPIPSKSSQHLQTCNSKKKHIKTTFHLRVGGSSNENSMDFPTTTTTTTTTTTPTKMKENGGSSNPGRCLFFAIRGQGRPLKYPGSPLSSSESLFLGPTWRRIFFPWRVHVSGDRITPIEIRHKFRPFGRGRNNPILGDWPTTLPTAMLRSYRCFGDVFLGGNRDDHVGFTSQKSREP